MTQRPIRLRRSVLYVPAANEKAVAKAETLACDVIVFDLEDAVSPEQKDAARERLRGHFEANPDSGNERVIRINALTGDFGTEDLLAARACKPDAILLPKVGSAGELRQTEAMLVETDAPESLRLWAMMETPGAMLAAGEIAAHAGREGSRLDCLVAGTNDLAKDLRLPAVDRGVLRPLLMQIVAAGRACGLDVIDGVFNAFRDPDGHAAECAEGAAMGFDGKSVIHPSQVEAANAAFGISDARAAEAKAIVEAFDAPENRGAGVIALDGRMVERLHLEEARRTLALAALQGGSLRDEG